MSDLALTHVGRHVVVQCPGEGGTTPYAGVLSDVLHHPRGASWLSFRGEGTPVVVLLEDPSATTVIVEATEDPEPAGAALPEQTSRRPLRSRLRST